MFDGISFKVADQETAHFLKNHSALVYLQTYDQETIQATYKNLRLIISETNVYIRGSLHEFYNLITSDVKQNYDRFSIEKLKYVIDFLMINFKINPERARIRSIEFGFNIILLEKIKAILLRFISYGHYRFNNMVIKGAGDGLTLNFKQYYYKFYDKGIRYDQPSNILRIEKHIKIMQTQFPDGLRLKDLTHKKTWYQCKNSLDDFVKKCIIIDDFKMKNMGDKEKILFLQGSNSQFLAHLTPRMRNYYLSKFQFLIEKQNLLNLKNEIIDLLEVEFNFLLNN